MLVVCVCCVVQEAMMVMDPLRNNPIMAKLGPHLPALSKAEAHDRVVRRYGSNNTIPGGVVAPDSAMVRTHHVTYFLSIIS